MHITVINPNSNTVYTEQISLALDPVRIGRQVSIDCVTLQNAPLAIESDDDVEAVVEPICSTVRALDAGVDGVVIACFADPGLAEARRVDARPIVGCCEAAVAEAITNGRIIGLISTGDDIEADRQLMKSYSRAVESVIVECPGIPTAEIPTHPESTARMSKCAEVLQAKGAAVVVLVCAGMACFAELLRQALSVPVIEPVSSAVVHVLDIIEKDRSDQYANNRSTTTA